MSLYYKLCQHRTGLRWCILDMSPALRVVQYTEIKSSRISLKFTQLLDVCMCFGVRMPYRQLSTRVAWITNGVNGVKESHWTHLKSSHQTKKNRVSGREGKNVVHWSRMDHVVTSR